MLRFKIALVVSLLVVGGALPALADDSEDTGATTDENLEADDHDRAAFMIANLLAAEFGATLEEVQELHELGLGLGSIFKLESLALALGTDAMSLLATFEVNPETGEYEFGWGQLKKTLTEDQLAVLDGLPKNLGQVVSAAKKHKHESEDSDEAGEDPDDDEPTATGNDHGHGNAFGHDKADQGKSNGKGKGKSDG